MNQISLLIDDVKRAFTDKETLSALALDVKEIFDAVLSDKMMQRLHDQKWPSHVVE